MFYQCNNLGPRLLSKGIKHLKLEAIISDSLLTAIKKENGIYASMSVAGIAKVKGFVNRWN
jgi:hypothetical protein